MSELIKRLKEERIQGSSAVLNYSNFDYWVNWDDIVDIVEDHYQPQLNENQQVVLGYLKEMMISFDLCNAIYRLESAEDWGHASEPYDIAYESLNDKERLQVVQAACQWAQGWEEPV